MQRMKMVIQKMMVDCLKRLIITSINSLKGIVKLLIVLGAKRKMLKKVRIFIILVILKEYQNMIVRRKAKELILC